MIRTPLLNKVFVSTFTFFAMFLALGASSCAVGVKPDNALAAIEAGDYTAIIEGCGNQPVVGYTYCRVREGEAAGLKLALIAPPAKCKDSQCVFYKIFFPTGEPAIGGGIDRGKTRTEISWRDLVKRDTFQKGDRGFWPVLMEVRWIDKDGRNRTSFAEGEIRLRVMSKEYMPLHETKEDPNFVWRWVDHGKAFSMTTGMRAYAGAAVESHK